MSDALFRPDGDAFVPHALTRGPWSPDAMHGGPVAALLARTAERIDAPGPMHPARLTVELLRPVPLVPLVASARVVRPGRKVQWIEAVLRTDDTDVARATLLRIRTASIPWPERVAGGDTRLPFAGPDHATATRTSWSADEPPGYHNVATEHRLVRGSWGELGPVSDWIRLRHPLVEGEEPSPLQRVAAVADFGNGVSAALPYTAYRFINPDLTIILHRLPETAWVCLDAATYPEPHGIGVAESGLYDERGRIGRAAQTLLLEAR
jgi:acyl-Coa thioesterase superfamily protein/acyl-CoA thioesterase superfamily protein